MNLYLIYINESPIDILKGNSLQFSIVGDTAIAFDFGSPKGFGGGIACPNQTYCQDAYKQTAQALHLIQNDK
jgi:hypothetical protein